MLFSSNLLPAVGEIGKRRQLSHLSCVCPGTQENAKKKKKKGTARAMTKDAEQIAIFQRTIELASGKLTEVFQIVYELQILGVTL